MSDWSWTLFDGLSTSNSEARGLPYITVKTVTGWEAQPRTKSFPALIQRLLPLPDPDSLEDASANILIALAIGWSLKKRRYTSYALALLLLVPGVAFLWNAIHQFLSPEVPEGRGMGIVGFGALLVNTTCAFLIARHRKEEGGLVTAAYYSARNDAIANVLII